MHYGRCASGKLLLYRHSCAKGIMDHYIFLRNCPPTPPPSQDTSYLGQNVGFGDGKVGSFPETYNDPALLRDYTYTENAPVELQREQTNIIRKQ